MAKRGAQPPEDDELDVIDLLTDEPLTPGRRPAPSDDADPDEGTPSSRTRRLIIGVALFGVALAGVLVAVTRDGGDEPEVGIESSEDSRDASGSDTDARSTPATLPPVPTLAWRDLGGRFALGIDGQLVIVDGATGQSEMPRVAPEGRVAVVDRGGGSALVSTRREAVIIDGRGRAATATGGTAFAGADGYEWFLASGARVSAVFASAPDVTTPNGLTAVASLRDGFLLHSDDNDGLWVWTSGSEPRPLAVPSLGRGTQAISLVAAHPDRIAWQLACPAAECGLHVSDVASGQDVVLSAGILPLFDSGRAYGRFSPDGRALALHVSTSLGEPGTFVLVDLTSGAIVLRREIDVRMPAPRSSSNAHPVPFDFTADGERVVVADWTEARGRLLVVRTADGAVEQTIEGVGPVDSLALLDVAVPPPAPPLFAGDTPVARFSTGGVLATLSTAGDMLTIVDIDTGVHRVVQLDYLPPANNSDFRPRLVALAGGFTWIRNGEAWFAPLRGDPVPTGAAYYVIPGGTPSEAWAVARAGDGYDVTRIDGETGARGATYHTIAGPEGAVEEGLVLGRPASFTRGSVIEVWNPATGRTQSTPVAARSPVIIAAGGARVMWYDQSCSGDEQSCATRLTDLATGQTAALPENSYASGTAAASPAGERLYTQVQDSTGVTKLTTIDPTTMQSVDVPGSTGADLWVASSRDFVVFQTNAIYLWMPGWTEPQVLSPGTFGIVGGLAMR